jgi:hypothetical protein
VFFKIHQVGRDEQEMGSSNDGENKMYLRTGRGKRRGAWSPVESGGTVRKKSLGDKESRRDKGKLKGILIIICERRGCQCALSKFV